MSDQQIQQIRTKLVNSQSKSFEMIAQLTDERDMARNSYENVQAVLDQVILTLGLENPTAPELFEALNKAITLSSKKPVS